MKANTEGAKMTPMVTLPLLGTVQLEFTHKELRKLEQLTGKPLGSITDTADSVDGMDATLYAAASKAAEKKGVGYEEFTEALDGLTAKEFMSLVSAALGVLNNAFADDEGDSEDDGDEKNAPTPPAKKPRRGTGA